jgi:hypothetical protein
MSDIGGSGPAEAIGLIRAERQFDLSGRGGH